MSRSIYWKFIIPLTVLVLLIMGALGIYSVNTTRNIQLKHLDTQLLNEAKLVAQISLPDFTDPVKKADLNTEAHNLGTQISTRVTLIAIDGTVLGDSEQDPSTMENHSDRPEVIQALASGQGLATRYSATLHVNMLYAAVTVTDQSRTIGIARVALPLTAVQKSVNEAVATTIAALVVAALGLMLASAFWARMVTMPVRQITGAAEEMAAGKLDQQIQVRTNDEIGRLGRAFNKMTLSIKDTLTRAADERSRLVAVLGGLTDGVVMTDADKSLVAANPAAERLFGFKETAASGKSILEVIHDHEVDAVVQNSLNTRREQTTQIDSASGRFIRVIAVPLTIGDIKGGLVIFQDLTEMRNLQTMRREFLGNISHELRTPLAAIKAISDTLRDGAIDDKEAAIDFLNRMDAEVDGMTHMVSEVIELSRIETGTIKLQLSAMDINQLAQETVTRLNPQAERKQITLETGLSVNLPTVIADKERIRQVLTNLLHNAIKFTPDGGKIVVSTSYDDKSVITKVTDTGIGISKEDLPHIFERFFKADKSRASTGTGLGLAIAKHIIQVHGGGIWVESEESKGSTFAFRLPLSPNS